MNTWVTSRSGFGSRQAGMQVPTKRMVPAGSFYRFSENTSYSNMAEAVAKCYPDDERDSNIDRRVCQAKSMRTSLPAAGFEKVAIRRIIRSDRAKEFGELRVIPTRWQVDNRLKVRHQCRSMVHWTQADWSSTRPAAQVEFPTR